MQKCSNNLGGLLFLGHPELKKGLAPTVVNNVTSRLIA